MKNIHPVYHVKTLMIKRELAKDPNLAEEDWSRFLPQFKKKSISSRRKPKIINEKKPYTPFPPAQLPSKVDMQIESGEYFLNQQQIELQKKTKKKLESKEKSKLKQLDRLKDFIPPSEKYNNNNDDYDDDDEEILSEEADGIGYQANNDPDDYDNNDDDDDDEPINHKKRKSKSTSSSSASKREHEKSNKKSKKSRK